MSFQEVRPASTDVFPSATRNANGSFSGRIAVIRQFERHATENMADIPGEYPTFEQAVAAAEKIARHQRS